MSFAPAFFRYALIIEIELVDYISQAVGTDDIITVDFTATFNTLGMHGLYSSGPRTHRPF